MKAIIEKYPSFVSVRIDGGNNTDKRIIIVKPDEYVNLNNFQFSYAELRNSPRIIPLPSDE